MGAAESKCAIRKSPGGLDLDGLCPFHGMLVRPVVAIGQWVVRIVESFFVDIHDVRLVHGVAPAQHIVVADGGESGAEERSAAHVPALVAVDVSFIPLADPEKGLVRIDEEQGVAVGALGRHDGPHIRALRFGGARNLGGFKAAFTEDELVVERVAIEGVDIPGFEMRDEARLHLQIARQEIVEALGGCIHQFLRLRTGAIIFFLR